MLKPTRRARWPRARAPRRRARRARSGCSPRASGPRAPRSRARSRSPASPARSRRCRSRRRRRSAGGRSVPSRCISGPRMNARGIAEHVLGLHRLAVDHELELRLHADGGERGVSLRAIARAPFVVFAPSACHDALRRVGQSHPRRGRVAPTARSRGRGADGRPRIPGRAVGPRPDRRQTRATTLA